MYSCVEKSTQSNAFQRRCKKRDTLKGFSVFSLAFLCSICLSDLLICLVSFVVGVPMICVCRSLLSSCNVV